MKIPVPAAAPRCPPQPRIHPATLAGLPAVICLGLISSAAMAQQAHNDSLTFDGITVYGTLDAALQYDSEGAPISDYWSNQSDALIQKNGREPLTALVSNGLSQSRLGLKGTEPLGAGVNLIFNVESQFNPTSFHLTDGVRSLILNNGIGCSASPGTCSQTAASDSSVDGELFGGAAWFGIAAPVFGKLTFGRSTTLLADGIAAYDPQLGSIAFSPLGGSGSAAGGGDTENKRLDGALRYQNSIPLESAQTSGTHSAPALHIGLLYQFRSGGATQSPSDFIGSLGTAFQAQLGLEGAHWSVDGYYAKKSDAISASSLSAAQVSALAKPSAAVTWSTSKTNADYAESQSVAATISDDTTWSIAGRYRFGVDPHAATVYGGYEHIEFVNPTQAIDNGAHTMGGYVLAFVNNNAYTTQKLLTIEWIGLSVPLGSQVSLTGGLYRYDQDSYVAGTTKGCSTNAHSNCAGVQNALSVASVWHVYQRFDVYAGSMWSQVSGGFASGYLKTRDVDATLGVRFTF